MLMKMDKEAYYQNEIKRLNKMIQVLVDRAEHGINSESSDFSLFQTTITLEEKVRTRTVELKRALDQLAETNEELDSSLSQLRETQERLVQSEKMAALANLVMGIGHELNTPLGVIVTTASFMQDYCEDLNTKVQTANLTASHLSTFISEMTDSAVLTLKSAAKLKELVAHFQSLSVSTTGSDYETVVLPDFFERLSRSLVVEYEVPELQVSVSAYPESLSCKVSSQALEQVLTHLFGNAVLHGVQDQANKQIQIDISHADHFIYISFSDNGVGIPAENLEKVFEPFFTTARSKGFVGLGLHMSYNLVHEVLKGSIKIDNCESGGACFTVKFPV